VCPYLGLIDDRATRFTFPATAHRCHATDRPSMIDIAKQGRDCLTAEHVTCPRYRPPKVLASSVPIERVQTVPHVVAAGRPGRSATGRRLARIAIVGIALIATVLVGLLLGAGLAAQLTGRAAPTPAPTVASMASMALPTPSPTRTSTPTPTPSRSPSPSPSPSASPTTSPSPTIGPIIHVVERGETLTSIAAEYGVTVEALKKANDIEDPNLIFVGQELVIPAV
jgi:nucleoid-associated protein YgaU